MPAERGATPAAIDGVAVSAVETICEVYGPSSTVPWLARYLPAIQTIGVSPEMNRVCTTHQRAGAFPQDDCAATTHPGSPPPTHPGAVFTLFGSNTAVHPHVSCAIGRASGRERGKM